MPKIANVYDFENHLPCIEQSLIDEEDIYFEDPNLQKDWEILVDQYKDFSDACEDFFQNTLQRLEDMGKGEEEE